MPLFKKKNLTNAEKDRLLMEGTLLQKQGEDRRRVLWGGRPGEAGRSNP